MSFLKNKYISTILAYLLIINSASAQGKEAYEMTVSGVKVIVQPSNNEIVQIQTVFKGGVQNYPVEKAGIESLAITALTECGTESDNKNSFKNKLDKVSGRIYGSSMMDYSTVSLNCIREDLNTVWPLYVDALTKPAFDEKEFVRIKQDAINNIKEMASQPDNSLHKLAKTTAFAGMNYAKDPVGTEESVGKLTVAEAKNFYKTIATRSRMLLVVVADIDRSDLEQKISALLKLIPEGEPFMLKKELFSTRANTFKASKKELATNYIQAVASGPPPGSKDYNAFVLAMRIFYDRHFLEVRTKNGLSYAPYTYFDGGLTPSANIVVSTTDPNKYIVVLNKLIANTKKGFTEEEVKNMKTTYVTSQYYREETNAAQANSLASNEVLHNNWRRAITLNEDLKNVTAKDVTGAFNKYLTNFVWVYEGDVTKVNPALYTSNITSEKLPPSSFKNKKISN